MSRLLLQVWMATVALSAGLAIVPAIRWPTANSATSVNCTGPLLLNPAPKE